MFERNTLTFNPHWDNQLQKLDAFTDVREPQNKLKERGGELLSEPDEAT